jgi:hypothetical protein
MLVVWMAVEMVGKRADMLVEWMVDWMVAQKVVQMVE